MSYQPPRLFPVFGVAGLVGKLATLHHGHTDKQEQARHRHRSKNQPVNAVQRLWLNGTNTTDHIEPFTERPLEGFGTVGQNGRIALQIHKGKPCEIRYKDIMIEELQEATGTGN